MEESREEWKEKGTKRKRKRRRRRKIKRSWGRRNRMRQGGWDSGEQCRGESGRDRDNTTK